MKTNQEYYPWYVATIAFATVLVSLPEIYIVSKTIARSDQNALQHLLFYVRLFKSILLLISGVALLYRVPWCKYAFLLISIIASFNLFIAIPGVNLVYDYKSDQITLVARAISFVIAWIVTIVIFVIFNDKYKYSVSNI